MNRHIEKLEDINDLNDLVCFIIDRMSIEDIEWIKSFEILDEKDYLGQTHDNLGRNIRNNCKLWEPDSHLSQFFKQKYDLNHPDDMSGIILLKLFKVLHLNFDENWIDGEVQHYKDHWKMMKTLKKNSGVYTFHIGDKKFNVSYAKLPYFVDNTDE